MNSEYEYLVGVQCMTYQHVKYIQDALGGFVMQQTTFPFTCMVMDDASTDGEIEILRKYIAEQCAQDETVETEHDLYFKVCTCSKENSNCRFEFYFLKQNLYGTGKKSPIIQEWESQCKYIALCEGDDYWTDPLKLQKQVDFMEMHKDCVLSFTNVIVASPNSNDCNMYDHLQEKDYLGSEIAARWTVPTCTEMFRYEINQKVKYDTKYMVYGDIFRYLGLAEQGMVHCINEKTAVYRRHEGGASFSVAPKTIFRLYLQYLYLRNRFPQWNTAFEDTLMMYENSAIYEYLKAHNCLQEEWNILLNNARILNCGVERIFKLQLVDILISCGMSRIVLNFIKAYRKLTSIR